MIVLVLRFIDKHIKVIFTLPVLVFIFVMVIFPLGYTVVLSFTEWSMSSVEPPKFVFLDNFIEMIKNERFQDSVGRTILFSVACLIVQTVLGMAVALLLNRDYLGKSVAKTIFMLPMVVTPVALGMVWLLIFEPTLGIANSLLRSLGLPTQPWLGAQATALWSIMIIDVWEWTPLIALIVLAGLSALPREPYESAIVDGATSWQTFWRITLPMVSPVITVAALLRLIDLLKTFDIIFSLTQGGPGKSTETLNLFAYSQSFQYFKFGTSSAVLVLFLIFVLLVSLLFIWLKNRLVVEQ